MNFNSLSNSFVRMLRDAVVAVLAQLLLLYPVMMLRILSALVCE